MEVSGGGLGGLCRARGGESRWSAGRGRDGHVAGEGGGLGQR